MSDVRIERVEPCKHKDMFLDSGGQVDGEKPHPVGPRTGFNRGGGATYESWCPGGSRTVLDGFPPEAVEAAAVVLWELGMVDDDDEWEDASDQDHSDYRTFASNVLHAAWDALTGEADK